MNWRCGDFEEILRLMPLAIQFGYGENWFNAESLGNVRTAAAGLTGRIQPCSRCFRQVPSDLADATVAKQKYGDGENG